MFHEDSGVQPAWPSLEADELLKDPPFLLAERFPAVVDSIVDAMSRDLKAKADALILQDVTECVQRFSDEITRVKTWRQTLEGKGVLVEVVSAESMCALSEEIVLCFLRSTAAMFRDVRVLVHGLVERSELLETCAQQRADILGRYHAVQRARDGIFELIGLHTAEEREEWEKTLTYSSE